MRTLATTMIGLAVSGSGCNWRECEAPDGGLAPTTPSSLADAGLYDDVVAEILAPGVEPYAPRFELWSDGAAKRRWISLPVGAQIDTTDMDAWQFPAGTKLFKEFTRDGVRVETRMLHKVGPEPDAWESIAYVWNAELTEAIAAPYGELDAGGTGHDVPAATECMACHGGTQGRILGFSAIGLNGDAASDGLDLAEVVARGWLSTPPQRVALELPGTPVERAALGYLHANCSHCHNQRRPEGASARCFDPDNELDFMLLVDELDRVESTRAYRSAVGRVIEPGDASASALVDAVTRRGLMKGMPPLGTEQIDDEAVALLRAWIGAM